jgi:DNA-binding response OmpR family regulator
MKLLLVLGSDDNCDIISRSLRPLGFELIRYRHVLKAMDNIDEINPAAIVISARDFPRHWKILVQFVRSERPKEICPIIILKGKSFSAEETSKAFYMGVSGVVDDALNKPEEMDRLQNVLSRYVPVREKRKTYRFIVEPWNRIGFLMAGGQSIITGDVKTISAGGLSFLPDRIVSASDIDEHSELKECSLRVGDAILSPTCRVVCTGKIISMEFVSFPRDERRILEQYLDEFSLLETHVEKTA